MDLSVYTQNRNLGLDVIRTFSIMLVVTSHVFYVSNVELGVWGVEIFFVLSGFLIGGILIRDFNEGITFKKIVSFWKRRWFRTLPLYYLVIVIKFLVFDSSLGYKIIAYVFFLQNNFVGISFIAVSWSLVIEEWFYLLLPLALFIILKNGFNKKQLTWFLIISVLFFTLLRFGWVLYSNRPFDAIRGNFVFRFDSLLIGVLLASVKFFFQEMYLQISKSFYCILGLLIMLLLIYGLGNTDNTNLPVFFRTFWFTLFSLSVALIIPYFEKSSLIKKISGVKVLFMFLLGQVFLLMPFIYYTCSFLKSLFSLFLAIGVLLFKFYYYTSLPF